MKNKINKIEKKIKKKNKKNKNKNKNMLNKAKHKTKLTQNKSKTHKLCKNKNTKREKKVIESLGAPFPFHTLEEHIL